MRHTDFQNILRHVKGIHLKILFCHEDLGGFGIKIISSETDE